MKVIILKTKEVKEVSLGYAVNYLLPKGLAVVATVKKLAEIKDNKLSKEKEVKAGNQKDRQSAEKLDGKVIEIKTTAGKSGKVHGSITKKEIAGKLEILKSNIVLEKPIKKLGEYKIQLKFGTTKATVKLKILAEDEGKK